jgi:hypothetical protein
MRRLSQILVLVLMATCAVAAGGFIAIAVYYQRFSIEVRTAKAPVPAPVAAMLPPAAGVLDRAQITLVRGSGTRAPGGVVLFRTEPEGGTTAFLSIPGSAVLAGDPLSRLDTPRLVRGLTAGMGIGVSHVVIAGGSSPPRLIDTAQALAPTSITRLQAAGRAVAGTATDLTDADVLGLTWASLNERRVVHCTFAQHQPVDSAQGRAIAVAFLARQGDRGVSACRAQSTPHSAFIPPKALVVLAQRYGSRAFAMLAAAAMLMSLAAAALFARVRSAGPPAAPDPSLGAMPPGPTLAVSLVGSAPATPRPSRADEAAPASVARAIAALSRVGLERATAIRDRVSELRSHGRRDGVARFGGGSAGSTYRSRVRRFAYTHQDAIWVALCAVVAAVILSMLLSS